jgi:superfamily II DNA/RNA helicase
LEKVYEELGLFSLKSALNKTLECMESFIKSLDSNFNQLASVKSIQISFENILNKLNLQLSQEEELDENRNKLNLYEIIIKYSSNKVKSLLEIFRTHNQSNKFWSIVFVERKYTASFLNDLIQKLSENSSEWTFLKSDLIYGSSRENNRETFNSIKQVV